MQSNLYDAKSRPSKLIDRALEGEEIVIANAGKPMVKLTPIRQPLQRVLGAAKGRHNLPDGWEQSMSETEYEEFTNGGSL